jgi:hypothetical protein
MALEAEAALEFHAAINVASFDVIYLRASKRYQRDVSVETNRRFLGRILAKMGQCSAPRRADLIVNRSTSGTFLTAQHLTHCDNGVFDEMLVWEVDHNTLKLVKIELHNF